MAEENGGGEGLLRVGGEGIAKFDGHEGVEAKIAERLIGFEAARGGKAEDPQSESVNVLAEKLKARGGGGGGNLFDDVVGTFFMWGRRGAAMRLQRGGERSVEIR